VLDLGAMANQVAAQFGIPPNIFSSMIGAESGQGPGSAPSTWNPNAVSSAGAQGLTQLLPGTAAGLGVNSPFDPLQNLQGGAAYLKQLYNQFGSWQAALQAYNAGPAAYQKDPTVSAGYASGILAAAGGAGGVAGANAPGVQPAGATGASVIGGQPAAASSGSLIGTGVKYGLFIFIVIALLLFGVWGTVRA
jgi:soluble lytic murein transglycosylase-like protein